MHFTYIYIVEQATKKSEGEAKSYLKAMSKTPSKRDTNFYLKMTVTTIIVGLYGQYIHEEGRALNH